MKEFLYLLSMSFYFILYLHAIIDKEYFTSMCLRIVNWVSRTVIWGRSWQENCNFVGKLEIQEKLVNLKKIKEENGKISLPMNYSFSLANNDFWKPTTELFRSDAYVRFWFYFLYILTAFIMKITANWTNKMFLWFIKRPLLGHASSWVLHHIHRGSPMRFSQS